MNKFLDFIARHAVISTTAFAILLILIGFGLLFKPSLILLILRYGLAVGNIGVGLVLLIRTLLRAAQK
ncbi:MAG: hypothetical protein J6A79_13530 [Clostridia bacterium]|nr:hypothetical protein [Clostridia bacterium]